VPLLLKARPLLALERKRRDLDEAIALCAGLWLDASTERPVATVGDTVTIKVQALNRSPVAMKLSSVTFEPAGSTPSASLEKALANNIPIEQTLSWKVASDGLRIARFRIAIGDESIEIVRPAVYRYVDRVRGELTRPFAVVPPVSASFTHRSVLFPSTAARDIEVRLRSFAANATGRVQLSLPAGWSVEPAAAPFTFASAGNETSAIFRVTPPKATSVAEARANPEMPAVHIIDYPHIPVQVEKTAAVSTFARADIVTTAKRIGYITGAGDLIPDALRQLGCDVTQLEPAQLAGANLSRFDAIVAGVRAYNVRADLRTNQQALIDYVHNGGTYIVQYNTTDGALGAIGPHPMKIGRDRVAVEEAPVTFLQDDHPLLNRPNKITRADFLGWVQERGLYFATAWDPKYETVIASSDPGEKPLPGGLLYTRYGKGVYIFTAYSWFRQLPAGVPGAYRIFANLLSAAQAR
jgi:hypothetical protein